MVIHLDRLEGSRKYLFGSMGVLGEDNSSILSGVLILRGQDHKAVLEVAPDWESYSFAKLDYAGADKDFFEAALAWDLEIDGKKWKDGKNVSRSHFKLKNDILTLGSTSYSSSNVAGVHPMRYAARVHD